MKKSHLILASLALTLAATFVDAHFIPFPLSSELEPATYRVLCGSGCAGAKTPIALHLP